MALIVTVVYEGPQTFALGVYPSLNQAYDDFLRIMRDQDGFPKYSRHFEEKYG